MVGYGLYVIFFLDLDFFNNNKWMCTSEMLICAAIKKVYK